MKDNMGALTGSHRSDEAPEGLRPTGFDPAREEALALCEQFICQVLVARDVSEAVDAGGTWQRLSQSPVRSIEAPEGFQIGEYACDIDSSGDGWIRFTKQVAIDSAEVRYRVGMTSSFDEVPEPLKAGIERLERHLETDPESDPPAVVTALWRPYRRLRS